MKISLAIISSVNDLAKLPKALKSIEVNVDEICVTVADAKDKLKDYPKLDGVSYSEFEWVDDFSAARAFNFSRCTGDWIVWMDTDDIFENAKHLRGLAEAGEITNTSGYAFLYKYNFDKKGNCVFQHWKTQFVKNDGHFEWKGAIHEDLLQMQAVNWRKTDKIVRVHDHNEGEEKVKQSEERNLRILEKELKKNPEEPRTYFYLGRACYGTKRYQESINYLIEYLKLSGWDEERYEASILIGLSLFENSQYDDALDWFNRAILEKEAYPDAYIYKGIAYMRKEDYKNALLNFQTAGSRKLPDANTFFNPMFFKRDYPLNMALAYMHTGDFENGLRMADTARSNDPKSAMALEIQTILRKLKEKTDTIKRYELITDFLEKTGHKDNINKLFNSLPENIASDPRMIRLTYKYKEPKVWEDDEIAIFCGNTVEPWTPENLKNGGIGGSETAVIELSSRLVEKGYRVTVYNRNESEWEEFDGVKYKNFYEFDTRDKFNVLWVWRIPELFDHNIDAKFAFLDAHDTMNPNDFTEKRLNKIDKILVKTKYHRSLYPKVSDDKFEIVGNGIDLDRFKGEAEKEPYRFMYSSTPNRGLDIILEHIWPKIIKEIPEAELHVYYGWKTFYEIEKNNPAQMAWMKKVQEMMNQPGVIDHGRVSQTELAKDMLKSSYWLYPTDFPEIHCITACEMQAAGVYSITSGYAALEETQKSGLKLKGNVRDKDWQEKYTDEVIAKAKKGIDKDLIKFIKEQANQFSWDLVAHEWDKIICRELKRKK